MSEMDEYRGLAHPVVPRYNADRAALCERLTHVAKVLRADGYDGHAQTVADAIAALMGAG